MTGGRAGLAPGVAVRVVVAAAVLALAGCGKKQETAPVAQPLPPEITGVFPEPWSTGVPYETPIWARFAEPLDPHSVDDKTVFLKVDTRRVPIQVTLEDSARRIVIHPTRDLDLRRTHTVEITSNVHTQTGGALATKYYWQFATNSLRHIEAPEPRDGNDFESPVAPLFWRPNDTAAGPVEYTVYLGPDSAQVAAGTASSAIVGSPVLMPSSPWPLGAWTYWKVAARNVETGDHESGPVWRFLTPPSDAAIDSALVRVQDCGWWDSRAQTWRCSVLLSSPSVIGIVRYDIESVDSTWCVRDAYIVLPASGLTTQNPIIGTLPPGFVPCVPGLTTPSAVNFLAPGFNDANSVTRFASILLASQIEARVRHHREFYGYGLTSDRALTYLPFAPDAGVKIYYYRPGTKSRPNPRSKP